MEDGTDARNSDAAAREEQLDRIIAEYLQAVDAKSAPEPSAVIAANPEFAADLAEFFSDRAQFGEVAGAFRADAGKPGITEDGNRNFAFTAESTEGLQTRAEIGELDPSAGNRHFGDYEILGEIARGGMGVVYRARQMRLHRIVALKLILASQFASAGDVRRFQFGAESAAQLEHPNIVPVYEVGRHAGHDYFTMKLIEGGSLAGKGSFYAGKQRDVARLVSTIARAVHYAHERGILHRDIKPANILIDADGQPHVTDFGLARRIDNGCTDATALTLTGEIVGSPRYMAPEVARGERGITVAADIWSLGAVLYELLTNQSAFIGETIFEVLERIRDAHPRRPSAIVSRLDRDLEVVCLKCLEKEPQRRYASAASLADDLERYLRHEPVHAVAAGRARRTLKFIRRHRGLVATTATVIVALSVALLIALSALSRETLALNKSLKEEQRARLVSTLIQEISEFSGKPVTELDVQHVLRRLGEHSLKDDPTVRAIVYAALADACDREGTRELAIELMRRAVSARENGGGEPADVAAALCDLTRMNRVAHPDDDSAANEADGLEQRARDCLTRARIGTGPESGIIFARGSKGASASLALAAHRAQAGNALRRTPRSVSLLADRGALAARAGDFEAAANDFAAAVVLDPDYQWWRFYGSIMHLGIGHSEEHKAACRQLFDRLGSDPDAWELERTAKACFAAVPLALGENDSRKLLTRLEGMIESKTTSSDASLGALPWLRAAAGMGAYRLGDFPRAIEHLTAAREALAASAKSSVIATIDFYLALSHDGLGHLEIAQQIYGRGMALVVNLPTLRDGDLGDGVENWLLARIAREEASKALKEPEKETPRRK